VTNPDPRATAERIRTTVLGELRPLSVDDQVAIAEELLEDLTGYLHALRNAQTAARLEAETPR
jgi:hypothetical protein